MAGFRPWMTAYIRQRKASTPGKVNGRHAGAAVIDRQITAVGLKKE
jgi:hypothetical protein